MDIHNYSALKLHKLGEKLREEDKHDEALLYFTQAIIKYTEGKNYKGLVDCLHGRFLTWKHLFLLKKDASYLELARGDVNASLSIAKIFGLHDVLFKCYFQTGEVYSMEEDYKKALPLFRSALKTYKGILSEKGRYRYHLGEIIYLLKDKEKGKKIMLQGLKEIEKGKGEVDSFTFNVWRSGCLLKLAELIRNESRDEAEKYLRLARTIINSDKRMIIRKRQFEELKKSF